MASTCCFKCQQPGHWARDCPLTYNVKKGNCFYCGGEGHWASECKLQSMMKACVLNAEPEEIKISSTRTCKRVKSFDDIMFENHLVVSKNMKRDVAAYIKASFTKGGIVDGCAVADAILASADKINFTDPGHLKTIGYAVAIYVDASEDSLKKFMHLLADEIENFDTVSKKDFGLIPVRKNGKMSFRKYTGYYLG